MTSSSSSSTASSPWMYFVAGSLLPTLAWLLMTRSSRNASATLLIKDHPLSLQEEEDDDDDHEGDFDNGDDQMAAATSSGSRPSSQWGIRDAPYKMMLCVNTDLAMGKGKMAAQCCHAAVGCFQRASRACPNAVSCWERTGCAKICVKCPAGDNGQALFELAQVARAMDVPWYLVEDAGRTQIAAGSRTVLGLGPAPAHIMDQITSHLKLM